MAQKKFMEHPGWEAQLVRASCGCTKVMGLVPGQDTYRKQPMNL